jgi:succinate dehydrogenase hydrophobic anchor subunit
MAAKKPATTAENALVAILSALVMLPLNAWIVMLVAGADHLDISAAVPNWSYAQSILVTLTLIVVGSFFYQARL